MRHPRHCTCRALSPQSRRSRCWICCGLMAKSARSSDFQLTPRWRWWKWAPRKRPQPSSPCVPRCCKAIVTYSHVHDRQFRAASWPWHLPACVCPSRARGSSNPSRFPAKVCKVVQYSVLVLFNSFDCTASTQSSPSTALTTRGMRRHRPGSEVAPRAPVAHTHRSTPHCRPRPGPRAAAASRMGRGSVCMHIMSQVRVLVVSVLFAVVPKPECEEWQGHEHARRTWRLLQGQHPWHGNVRC